MSTSPKDQIITFSYNWNNKLDCKAFTTLRLKQGKYVPEKVYDIYLEKKGHNAEYLGKARCEAVKDLHLEQVNEFIAYLDTGYNTVECRRIVRRMYGKENPEMQLILLVWVKRADIEAPAQETK